MSMAGAPAPGVNMGTNHASATIALAFMVSVAAFALWTGYLLLDARRQRALPVPAHPPPTRGERRATRVVGGVASERPPSIGRLRLAVVLLTFLVWSLIVTDHVHPRR
jgi:hypothetical protein